MGNNIPIAKDFMLQRNEGKFIANKIGEDLVMMNMESGDFVAMNSVGAAIWELTETPISTHHLIQNLLEIYDIVEDQCINETTVFLEMSRDQELFLFPNSNAA